MSIIVDLAWTRTAGGAVARDPSGIHSAISLGDETDVGIRFTMFRRCCLGLAECHLSITTRYRCRGAAWNDRDTVSLAAGHHPNGDYLLRQMPCRTSFHFAKLGLRSPTSIVVAWQRTRQLCGQH